jgi:SAM-dependent methyltransferase
MKEEDIRPKEIFDEYLRLCKKDAKNYFGSNTNLHPILCPACCSSGVKAFEKNNFTYEECPACSTLYVSPRPEESSFFKYYQESESVKFWANSFYKKTAEARREKLWKPKALMISESIKKYGDISKLFDIGGGYGIFAEEFKKLSNNDVTVIEPGPDLAEICRNKGLDVIENFLEKIDPKIFGSESKAFVSFELFEHLHSPEKFLLALEKIMKVGDLFIFTTLSGIGLDIRALWDNSQAVSPPHHLNFLNPHSVNILLARLGFKVLEISTPGKLDLDILNNNFENIQDNFWKHFIRHSKDAEKIKMQKLISESGFSSHMLVICKK